VKNWLTVEGDRELFDWCNWAEVEVMKRWPPFPPSDAPDDERMLKIEE